MKEQVETIQQVLDAAISKGIIGNLKSAGIIAIAWEEIKSELAKKTEKDGTDH